MKLRISLVLFIVSYFIACTDAVYSPKVTIRNKSFSIVINECARWLEKNDYSIETRSETRIVGKSNGIKVFNSLFDPWVYREYLEFVVYDYHDSLLLTHSAWRVYNEGSHIQKIQYENSQGEVEDLQEHLDSVYALIIGK